MSSSCIVIYLVNKILSFIWNTIVNNFADYCALATTILIAMVNYKYLKKQDEKNARLECISRKANFQSIVIFGKILKITLYLDSIHNYTESMPYKNVLFNKKNAENGNTYAFDMIIYLNNLTNIFPSEILVEEILIWDNSIDHKEHIKQMHLRFINYFPKYKMVTINGNKETCIDVLCCLDKDELLLLSNYDKKDTIFNFNIAMSIKNSCNIINNCKVRGTFKMNNNKKDLSSGCSGGAKKELTFEIIESFLNISDIEEEVNNE